MIVKALRRLFQPRFKGLRVVDLSAFAILAAMAMSVYAYKAHEGGETSQLVDADRRIADQQRQIRVLQAELARLEQPARLERLSVHVLGLEPAKADHETTVEGLMEISRQPAAPLAPTVVSTAPTPVATAASVDPAQAQAGATHP
jgi:hypothetical protein